MCDNCFVSIIPYFNSQDDWEKFETELLKKLLSKKLYSIPYEKRTKFENEQVGEVYECGYCHQRWLVDEPDSAIRGYLLKVIEN